MTDLYSDEAWDPNHTKDVARAALEGAIRNVETAAELQSERFQRVMLECWLDADDPKAILDTLSRADIDALYGREYEKRAEGAVEDGYRYGLSSEDFESIDGQEGVEQGLGIALDVLRKMLERL